MPLCDFFNKCEICGNVISDTGSNGKKRKHDRCSSIYYGYLRSEMKRLYKHAKHIAMIKAAREINSPAG
jgi:hypothetical protein